MVINEIMYAPSKLEPEWIEILNAGGASGDLAGYTASNLTKSVTLPEAQITPGAFCVLTRDSALLRKAHPGNYLILQISLETLKNTGDYLILRDSSGHTTDSLFYDPAWGGSGGRSLERKDITAPSTSGANWFTSIDTSGSTPGRANSYLSVPVTQSGAVVINEIMFAPLKPEPEWIELLNTSRDTIDLSGWAISDAHYSPVSLEIRPTRLAPDSFFILTSNDSQLISARHLDARKVLRAPLRALSNSGSTVRLHDLRGALIDSIVYDGSAVKTAGRSLERVDAYRNGYDASNWKECEDSLGATPLAPNSARRRKHDLALVSVHDSASHLFATIANPGRDSATFVLLKIRIPGLLSYSMKVLANILPGDTATILLMQRLNYFGSFGGVAMLSDSNDERHKNDTTTFAISRDIPRDSIQINELMFNPRVGSSEWVEIYNQSAATVSLSGCLLDVYHAASQSLLPITSLVVAPKSYGVIAANSGFFISYPWLANRTSIASLNRTSLDLSKDSGSVNLKNADSTLIDTSHYLAAWQSAVIANGLGVSYERRSLDRPALDSTNWMSCTDTVGATPLARNSQVRTKTPGPAPTQTISVSPNPFSPDGDGFEDMTTFTITSGNDQTYALSIRLYNMQGELRRTIVDNLPYTQSASVAYDGRDDQGRHLPLGMYSALIELDSSTGKIQKKIGVAIAGRRR